MLWEFQMLVRTYKELEFFLDMFKNGNAELLVLESRGGLGKSRLVEETMKEIPHLKILSHVTPMQLYILGYKFKDVPIIIDDVDGLLSNNQNISLLKVFCETRETKRISWLSTCGLLREQNIPLSYETKSKVLILTNDFQTLSKKVGALQDRGWHIIFKPTDEEVLNKINQIKGYLDIDISSNEIREVYSLIEKHSNFCDFSIRTFIKGLSLYKQCKEKKVSWKEILLQEMGLNNKLILISQCINKYDNEKERIAEWKSHGFSKRSYYDYKLKLVQKCNHIPKIPA